MVQNPQPDTKGMDDLEAAEKFMEAGHAAGSNHGLATAMYTGALARACIAIAHELRNRGGK